MMIKQGQGEAVSKKLGLCLPVDTADSQSVAASIENLINPFMGSIQYNKQVMKSEQQHGIAYLIK